MADSAGRRYFDHKIDERKTRNDKRRRSSSNQPLDEKQTHRLVYGGWLIQFLSGHVSASGLGEKFRVPNPSFVIVYAIPPPSTTRAEPVTKLLASLASHRTAAAISSGSPTRPNGRSADSARKVT